MIIFLGKFFVLTNLGNLILILVFIPLVFLSKLAISLILGVSAFFTIEHGGACNFYENVFPIASGLVFSLSFLQNLVWFYPFSYLIYQPTQIYLGKYYNLEIVYTFIGGIAWCIILWLLARIVFKLGLKRNEAVGL